MKAHDVIEELFPRLNSTNYTITSCATVKYNCVAWAVGDIGRWWEAGPPTKGYYWPPGVEDGDSVDDWGKLFQLHGYTESANQDHEKGFEKIAIYADNEGAQHVARQLQGGKWTSKLGNLSDVEHANLAVLEGTYGNVVRIMKRARPDWDQ